MRNMDSNYQALDDGLKKEIEKKLTEKLIDSVEDKKINLTQMKEIANYILDSYYGVKNYSQLMVFLNDLKSKWKIYLDTYTIYQNLFHKDREKQVIDRLSSYISKLKN